MGVIKSTSKNRIRGIPITPKANSSTVVIKIPPTAEPRAIGKTKQIMRTLATRPWYRGSVSPIAKTVAKVKKPPAPSPVNRMIIRVAG